MLAPMPPADGTDELAFVDTAGLDEEPGSAELAALAPLAELLDPQEAPRLAAGTVLADNFLIEEPIGSGGMGIVYRARDLQLGRAVALKLHRPMEHGTDRLRREAASMAKLTHPNVATVHEVGTHDGMLFIAMELVDGVTARRWVAQTERTPLEIVALYHAAGLGLAAAHRAGLVHRDFKPENVLVDGEDVPRVVDFGLARQAFEDSDSVGLSELQGTLADAEPGSLTMTGAVVGTPAYMAPEQFQNREVDARTDQYSFCVSLYEAVYGSRPHVGASLEELRSAVVEEDVPSPPKGSRVPGRLRRVLLRGLAKEPSARWPSMEALLDELAPLLVPRARKWMIASAAVGLIGLGGGLALAQLGEPRARCDADKHLAGVWDDARRGEVQTAITGTGLPYAPRTWEQVERALDGYAEGWATTHTAMCTADVEDAQGEEDRRLRLDCMHERVRALRATVDVLAEADTGVVERAVGLATSLPGFDRCDDLEALRAAVPPPEDDTVRAEVESLRDRLADIRAAYQAGRYAEGLTAVASVMDRIDAVGHAPLIAEARALRGRLRHSDGAFEDAEADLLEAHDLALAHRHHGVVLEAAQQLAWLVGVERARHDEGTVWARVAVSQANHNREDLGLALSLDGLAMILSAKGEHDIARAHLERAVALVEATDGADSILMARMLNDQGELAREQSRYGDMLALHQRSLEIREAQLGATHPDVAKSLGNIGVALRNLGRNEEALAHHERARSVRETSLGPDHPSVANGLQSEGVVLMGLGRYGEAQQRYERALRINERVYGEEHPSVAGNLDNLGSALDAQGKYEEAKAVLERALGLREALLGPQHADVAFSLTNLSAVLQSLGDVEGALHGHERASSIFVEALRPDHLYVGVSLINQARALESLGRLDEARARLERSLAIQEKAVGPEHPRVGTTLNNLGSVLRKLGEHEEGRRLLERALAIDEKVGEDHPDVAFPLTNLAETAVEQGDFEAARAYAERAIQVRKKASAPPEQLARTRVALAKALAGDPDRRGEARKLAEQAHAGFVEAGTPGDERRVELEAWFGERGWSVPEPK